MHHKLEDSRGRRNGYSQLYVEKRSYAFFFMLLYKEKASCSYSC